jgi:deoxyribose-phosphate aldolase
MNLSRKIDHTCLGKKVKKKSLKKTVKEAKEYNMNICINPCFVESINNFDQKIVTVVGFPMGQQTILSKKKEGEIYISEGADEIDYCANLSNLLNNKEKLEEEFNQLSELDATVKCIIETGLLDEKEMIEVCNIANQTNIDYVKTCSGYFGDGVKLEDVELLRENLLDDIKIKASGGIKDKKFALDLLERGANRIGASSGVRILQS